MNNTLNNIALALLRGELFGNASLRLRAKYRLHFSSSPVIQEESFYSLEILPSA